MDLRLDQQVPDLATHGGQLGRIEGGDLGVRVEQHLELGQVVVGLGPGERRDEVVDNHCVASSLGLGPLARGR